MSKRLVFLALMAICLVLATPASAASSEGDVETNAEANKDQTTGKHNFEQWQTIKRLQVTR